MIRIVKKKSVNGSEVDLHNILAFDVKQLPQASKHQYVGEDAKAPSIRAKVPVKDGRSQAVSNHLNNLAEISSRVEGQNGNG